MSIELVAWALRQKIDDPVKVTLISLANRAKGPEGCWPKIRLIAEDTQKSERTVKRHIEALVDLGLITTERRKTYLIYKFCLDQEVTTGVTSESQPEKCHEVSLQEVPSGVTSHMKENRKKDSSSLRSEETRATSKEYFDLFWRDIPRKRTASKQEAWAAWQQHLKTLDDWQAAWIAASGYAEEKEEEAKKRRDGDVALMHPCRFISKGIWRNYADLEEAA